MLLQTNSYIVPREKRAEHARLLRRFRQTLMRLGCDHFEVYEQTGPNWSSADSSGRFVQIMRFRDRKHQIEVQNAERGDATAQSLLKEFCELINLPYQQQQGLFAVGFYQGFLRMPEIRHDTAAAPSQAEPASQAEPGSGADPASQAEPQPEVYGVPAAEEGTPEISNSADHGAADDRLQVADADSDNGSESHVHDSESGNGDFLHETPVESTQHTLSTDEHMTAEEEEGAHSQAALERDVERLDSSDDFRPDLAGEEDEIASPRTNADEGMHSQELQEPDESAPASGNPGAIDQQQAENPTFPSNS